MPNMTNRSLGPRGHNGMLFIGDLSRADAELLEKCAHGAKTILEFGVGGSTQIVAQAMPADAEFFSIETNDVWIGNTENALSALGLDPGRVRFLPFRDVFPQGHIEHADLLTRKFDFVFVDGELNLRDHFLGNTFDLLRVGGLALIHDTRRYDDVRYVLTFCIQRWQEISRITLNAQHSNITVIEKKSAEPYENWNEVEGKETWESGYAPPPPDWVEQLKRKSIR